MAAPQPEDRQAFARNGSIHTGPGSYSHSLTFRIQCFSTISHHLVLLCPLPSNPRPKKLSRHFFSNCSPNTLYVYVLYVCLCFIPKRSKICLPPEPVFAPTNNHA